MHNRKSSSVLLGLLCFAFGIFCSHRANAQKAIYIVRHAEKELTGTNPPLTAAGKKRAQALADLLKNANIKAIYTSHWLRTKQTAEPLATTLSITPEAITNGDPEKTFESALTKHWNEAILVVGHSDTIEDLLKKWAASASIDIQESDFSSLLIVTPEAPAKAGWVRLRYEAP